jgi:iron complex outermembrane recepter protein
MKKNIAYTLLSFTYPLCALEIAPISIESSPEDTLLEAPYTLNALNQERLEVSNIKNLQELSSLIPNTNISGIGNRMDKTISLRGIGNYVTLESSVAMYIDDTPVPYSYGFGMADMKNVEKIEFFKGAQGTKFGKSAQSGVINLYTRAPQDKFTAIGSLGYGSYNTRNFYGFVSSPIKGSDFKSSFSITKEKSNGFSENLLTGGHLDKRDFTSFSAKLEYDPSSPLNVRLNYTKSASDDGGSPFKINTKENPYSIDNEPNDDYVKMDQDLLSLIVKYQKSDSTFTSATTFTDLSILRDDYVGIPGTLLISFDIDIQEFTQELRYNKSFQHSELSVGAFYSDKLQFDYKENMRLMALGLNSRNVLQNPDEMMALFSQYRYFFNDNYSLLAGMRYQRTKRSFSRDLNNFGAPTTHSSASSTWSQMLPTLSLSYQPDPYSNLYFTYSKGYNPGGYTYRGPDPLVPFKARKADTFELGYKQTASESFSLNTALFYTILSDHGVNQFSDTLAPITYTISKGHSYGWEIEGEYKNDTLFVFGSLGLTKTKIDDSGSMGTYNNKQFIDVPDVTASLGLKYDITHDIYLKSDARYMGKRYYNLENSSKDSGYSVVDAALGYQSGGWSVELYSDNVFNKHYVDFMISTPSNTHYHFAQPRMSGIRASKSF